MGTLEMILICLGVGIVFAYSEHLKMSSFKQNKTDDVYIYNLTTKQIVERADYLCKQIDAIDDMLIDMTTATENNIKAFRMQWNSTTGNSYETDLFIDGQSDVTGQSINLMQKRRQELVLSLHRTLSQLPKRHGTNVEQTFIAERRGGD